MTRGITRSNHGCAAFLHARASGFARAFGALRQACLCLVLISCAALFASAQTVGGFEGRIVNDVLVEFEGTSFDDPAAREMRAVLTLAPGSEYAAVRVRDSLQALFVSGLVSAARVEVRETAGGGQTAPITVAFVVRRQARVGAVALEIDLPDNSGISRDELRAQLNQISPGDALTSRTLGSNADLIQEYLRERGYFRADVEPRQEADTNDPTGVRQRVIFRINPGERATVAEFAISITGFDDAPLRPKLKTKTGAVFSRENLDQDVRRIREALIKQEFLAPLLTQPQITLDAESNRVTIRLTGSTGAKVAVAVEGYKVGEDTQRELFPVLREGTADYSALVEGARRLRNKLQEDGYFFAEVVPFCSIAPPYDVSLTDNTEEVCASLNPEELNNRNLRITYRVTPGDRLKLTEIALEGTDKLKLSDVSGELKTRTASALGFLPIIGLPYGRTSPDLLGQDRRLIQARMRDLGYRRASVETRQDISADGKELKITFVINEGEITRVTEVKFEGNTAFSDDELRATIAEAGRERCQAREDALILGKSVDELPCYRTAAGEPFSRTQVRADGDSVLSKYLRAGYADAQFETVITEGGNLNGEDSVIVTYRLKVEGDKVYVRDILIVGATRTDRNAILRVLTFNPGDLLRADRLTESERALYRTDAFQQLTFRTREAGTRADGSRERDVIIEVVENKPRLLTYGGGYSTNNGPLGLVDIRNVNLFGSLKQGAVRLRVSQLQQLAQLEYIDPRWQRYGDGRFMPLTISAQYQRDSTVTRFFRSTIDRGAFGIVQRLDEDGNPIDEFGNPAGEPTINRFTLRAETQRSFDREQRTQLFLRYSYEDVRLIKINSLLIANLLRPDRVVRLSRFGATFVRDTRDQVSDSSRGDYLTFDYDVSLRQIGGNISFSKLQLNYRRFARVSALNNTVLAANFNLGVGNLFSTRDRDGNGVLDETDLRLPISERFFAGGSTTHRGFGFEEAGPRQIFPECFLNPATAVGANCGLFRDRNGMLIRLNPFTVPVGGDALAIVNLEARVPVTNSVQVVPFYDGGNVFRRFGDIFSKNRAEASANGIDPNLLQSWNNTVGLGLRLRTPVGGAVAIDYAFVLNPTRFTIPQTDPANPTAIYQLPRTRFHFRFTQTF